MFKFHSFLLFLIIYLSLFPSLILSEKKDNSTEKKTETPDNTNKNKDNDSNDDDPYKDIDFGNVITLHDSNATSEIKKYELIYLIFYSPWCKYCHKFFPEYVAASKYAEENNLKVKFAKIDGSMSTKITDQYKVPMYPTVILVNKTINYTFEGPKTKEGLIKFVERKFHDDVFEVSKLSEVEKYANSSIVILSTLRYFNTALYQSFLNYSKTNMNVDFVMCLTEECLKEYGHNIVIYKKFDEKKDIYTKLVGPVSQATLDAVKNFFGVYGIEAGAPLTYIELNMLFDNKKKMLFYFRKSSKEEQTKYDKVMKELGIEFRNKNIYTVVSDIKGSEFYDNVAETFNMVPKDLPALVYYDLNYEKNKSETAVVYSLRNVNKNQLTKEYIKDYINKINEGKVKEDLFSQPPLDNYNISGVRYVIGRNYDEHVIEEKNNVFIIFLNSNSECPECEKILDMMVDLAKKYPIHEKKTIFSYMDLAGNQPRDINVEGEKLPLFLLYTNAMKEKKIIKLDHANPKKIKIEEIEEFLYKSLNWEKKPQKEETKKEEKKESDL